jgi:hypothetical protein
VSIMMPPASPSDTTPTPRTCQCVHTGSICGQSAVAVVGASVSCGCTIAHADVCEECMESFPWSTGRSVGMCRFCHQPGLERWSEPVRLRVATER